MKQAAIYLRRSTDRQEQSIGDQRREIHRYVQQNGFEVVREYVDDAISGAVTEDRRAFLQMVQDAQAKPAPFRFVLVFDVSRFGRAGSDEAGYWRHTLSQAGVEVIYVAEGLRGDRTDDLILGVKTWLAHQFVQDLSKVTIRGQVSRVEKGRWCGGRAPYGYDLAYYDVEDRHYQTVRFNEDGTRQILSPDGAVVRVVPRGADLGVTSSDRAILRPGDPARVQTLQKIFEWYLAGQGFGGIAARINALGVPPPGPPRGTAKRRGWSQITIRDILRNPAYRGALAWNRRTFSKFNTIVQGGIAQARPKHRMNKQDANPEKDWIVQEDQHEALVPPEAWHEVQRTMRLRAGQTTPEQGRATRRNSPFLLSGIVTCSRCGSRFQGYKTRKGRKKKDGTRVETFHYACGGYVRSGNAVCRRALVRKEEFENGVLDAMLGHIGDFVATGGAPLLEGLITEQIDPVPDRRALEEKLASTRKQLAEKIACLTPALAPILEPAILELRREVERIEANLAGLDRKRLDDAQARALVEQIVTDLGAISSAVRAAPFLEQREMVRAITSGVVLNPKTGEATVRFHAIPQARFVNGERTEPWALSSHYTIAGARSFAGERTFGIHIVTEEWELEEAA